MAPLSTPIPLDPRDVAMRAREHAADIVLELLGPPLARGRVEWRWGKKGSLAVIVGGEKAGFWFDHESGQGGAILELISRELGTDRLHAISWAADRLGLKYRSSHSNENIVQAPINENIAAPAPAKAQSSPAKTTITYDRAAFARSTAEEIWQKAMPAHADHPYLVTKCVLPHDLRCDRSGNLIVPLRDIDGLLHTIERIAPDGKKRFLSGGAKADHFATIGPSPSPSSPILICEGWATGASLYEATGLAVIAAMDAGNMVRVAPIIRERFPEALITIVADNDEKPDRAINPGLLAAKRAATAIDAQLAVPPQQGDANDLANASGQQAIRDMIAAAQFIAAAPPTYAPAELDPSEARNQLQAELDAFLEDVRKYWPAAERAAKEKAEQNKRPFNPKDLNIPTIVFPPILGLAIDVGLGKSTGARALIAALLKSGAIGNRKVVYGVPRHDLGQDQVEEFEKIGVKAMLWKGRSAPDPSDTNSEQLMCLDIEATQDAIDSELQVEPTVCKLRREAIVYRCQFYDNCGYQRQKHAARKADVIVCAHDALFHIKPTAISDVGLLVIDEAFWQAGLRGVDGKTTLTQDGLEPSGSAVVCYDGENKMHLEHTADLIAARVKLWKALQATEPGPLRHGLLEAVGLTAKECRHAANLERYRWKSTNLMPGMSKKQRQRKLEKIRPQHGEPWAPPGRCAIMWELLAEALDQDHDAAGVVIAHEKTEHGSIRALRLSWRSELKAGWSKGIPILHLDATLQPELAEPFLPYIKFGPSVRAKQEHVRIRQVLGTPTAAKALTPPETSPERDHIAAKNNIADLKSYIALRTRESASQSADQKVLVIGQKKTIEILRDHGLPPRVEAVHFNALSGLNLWGQVATMIILGRTLPAPAAVEQIGVALTGRNSESTLLKDSWWYPTSMAHIGLSSGKTHEVKAFYHPDQIAEAIRWTICEGELVQAVGRGRGVNRTTDNPLQIDLLTDVVLPLTVDDVIVWNELRPGRFEIMALSGAILENAADMAKCFPKLWPTTEAARQDRARSVTNCYYRSSYNSNLSRSSVSTLYQIKGPGQKPRRAQFDLSLIPDPQKWLTEKLGPLAAFNLIKSDDSAANSNNPDTMH